MALGTHDSSMITNDTSVSSIFSVLSDSDSLKIIGTIASHHPQDLKIGDFDTPKRYYSRVSKIKKTKIKIKKGKKKYIT